MQKKLFLFFLLIFSLLEQSSLANHLMGGSLTYQDRGFVNGGRQKRYTFTLKLYRDCNGGGSNLPNSANIGVYIQDPLNPNNPDKDRYQSYTLNLTGPIQQIPPLTPTASCSYVPVNVCVQEGIYESTVDIDTSSSGYHIIYENFARNTSISNLMVTTPPVAMAFYAVIPSTQITNSTPAFSSRPVSFFCANTTISFYNTASDPDGDSLVYQLVHPYQGYATMVDPPPLPTYTFPIPLNTYNGGYNSSDVFGPFGTSTINLNTGISQFSCTQVGFYVVVVEVSEYRNGQLLSRIRRDLQIIVDGNCPYNPNPGLDNTVNPAVNDTMYINEGDNVCFPINFSDPNGDSLFVTYSGTLLDGTVTPGPVITGPLRGEGFITNTLCWQTQCGQGRSAPYTFRVTLQDDGCPSFPIPIDMYVFVRKPQPNVTGPTVVCTMDNNRIYNITGGTGSSFSWIAEGGTPPGGTSTNLSINWGAPGAGVIKVLETNQFGCESDTLRYNVNIRSLPVATITGPAAICYGGSATLEAPLGYTYSWTDGITSNSRAVLVSPAATTTYTLSMTDGYCWSLPVSHVLTVNPLPVVSISKTTDNNCPEVSNVTLTASGGATYIWSNGSAGPQITVTPAATTTYAVTSSDNNGCTNTANVTVNVLPPCRVSLQSATNDTICYGQTVVLSDMIGMASSFKWYEEAFPGVVKGTSSTFAYTASPMPASNPWGIVLEGTDVNGCVGKDTFKVFIRNLPTIQTAKSIDSICPRDSVKLIGAGATGGYFWYIRGNMNDTLNAPSGDSAIWVTPSVTTYYVLEGKDRWPCSNFDTIKVNVRPSPPITISTANDSICIGSSTVLTGLGGKDYSWSLLSSPGTVISTSRNLFITPASSSTYVLLGTDKYGCKNLDTLTITILNLPNIQASATPPAYCPGDSSVISGSGGVSYLWSSYQVPDVVVNTDNQFTVTATSSSTYIVTGTDQFGCVNKDTLSVTVKNKPPKRRILGTTYACPGLENVLYRISDTIPSWPVSGSSFLWTLAGAAPAAGQNMNADSLKINFSSTPGTATIIVVETNGEGCLGDTMRLSIEIKEIFTPPKPNGPDKLCTKDTTGRIYNTPFNTIGSVYQWHVIGGRVISGNGTSQAVINWDTIGVKAGKIWFEEISSTATANCYGLSDTLFVSIYQSPLTGGIVGKASVCINDRDKIYYVTPNSGSTYTWFVQNAVIQEGNGTYTVKITWNTPGTEVLKVVEKSPVGCVGDTVYLTVKINPLPVVDSIMGPAVICPSSLRNQLYHIRTPNPGSRYLWSIQNGTIVSGGENDSVYVNWNIDFTSSFSGRLFNISVIEMSADSCIGSAYITKPVKADGSIPAIDYVTATPVKNEIEIKWPVSYKGGELNSYSLYKRPFNYPSDTAWKYLGSLSGNVFKDLNVSTYSLAYQYKYIIRDMCGDSSASLPHNSMLLGATVDKAAQRILLDWNTYSNWPNGLRTFEVWRKLDNDAEFTYYQSTDTATRFMISDPMESFRHCYRVKALQDGGSNVSWSNDTCVVFEHLVNIPSAFSPNGDGKNDTWTIRNIQAYKDVSIEVFSRWGEKVFEASGYSNDWDGTMNGKALPDATYFYVIKLKLLVEGQKETYTGNVTIMR